MLSGAAINGCCPISLKSKVFKNRSAYNRRRMSRKKKAVCLALSILLFFHGQLYSQDQSPGRILVMLSTGSSVSREHEGIRDIIDNGLSIEMHIRNFQIVRHDLTSENRLISLSRKAGASYLVRSLYSLDSSTLTVQYSIIRISDSFILGEGEFSETLNFELDASMQKELSGLVDYIERDYSSNPDLVFQEREEQDVIQPTEEPGDFIFRPFYVAAAISPFFTAGQASTYFSVGLQPEVSVLYKLKLNFGYLGTGAFLSMNYSRAEGLISSSENIFLSFGPLVRLGFQMNSRLDFFLDLNGGISLFFMNANSSGYKSTIIPYLSGGIGINMDIAGPFGIFISGDYSVYFENSLFISGFSPFAGIYLSL